MRASRKTSKIFYKSKKIELMKKNKINLVILVFIIFLSFFYFNLTISKTCKSTRVLTSVLDFGISHIDNCHSNKILVWKIKEILKSFPNLYEKLKDFNKKNKIFATVDYPFNEAPTQKDLDNVKIKIKTHSNIELPYIKGLINLEFKDYKKKQNIFEFENWNRSHGDHINSKFHPGTQITKKNIKNLKLVWKYESIDKKNLKKKHISNVESNPIFINNKIISVTPDRKIIANDSITGTLLWSLQSFYSPARRGMLSYKDPISKNNYLIAPLGNKIYKINVENGKIEKNFNKKGFVKSFTLVAPIIYKKKLVIVGTNTISIFDLDNGKKIGTFSLKDKNRNFRKGIVWGGSALDKSKGIVFVTTGNPHPATYGVNRPGDNRNSCSLIAFDLNKKKILWTFQETIHDLWDFDLASPPILHDLKIDSKVYEVVIALSKTGNTIILERNSGKPIFDITYRKAPKSSLPGEYASPFQIFLKKPERFSKIEFSQEDFNKLSIKKIEEINNKIKNSKFGWFETPDFEKDLITFGVHGGAQWMGAAIDPLKQYLYIPVNNVPWKIKPYLKSTEIKTKFSKEFNGYYDIYLKRCSSCHGRKRNGKHGTIGERQIDDYIPSLVGYYSVPGKKNKFSSISQLNLIHSNLNLGKEDYNKIKLLFNQWDNIIYKKKEIKVVGGGNSWSQLLTSDNLPASNPPWGYIAKLNLKNGKIIWKAPHGDIKINDKKIKVGTEIFGGVALNGSDILFMTGTDDSKAYAIDAVTGEEIWSFEMDAAGSAPPTIFEVKGNQYISFISTGGNYHSYKNKSSTIYTFGIVD